MGRPAFIRFLNSGASGAPIAQARSGVRWGQTFASWDDLLKQGRQRGCLVRAQRAYVVDPTAGVESLASLLAVATVADTMLLWASVSALGVPHRALAAGLYEIDAPLPGPFDRPLWGVCTSGSSGVPKVAIGHADLWELVALHYDQVMLRGSGVLATCLPLQFSAAFFMTVLPALFLRRNLVVFPSHDWTPVHRLARRQDVFLLAVPALAAAACLGTPEPVEMSRVSMFLGGGHVSAERLQLIHERFTGTAVANLYGTAETGAVAVDPDPGHNRHVGRPIPGKAVWIEGCDDRGVGAVAVAGPDCCRYLWRPGAPAVANPGRVASTDYGRFDDEGQLCLEGRVDGGEKLAGVMIYPRTIERHLLALQGVVDARVIVRRRPSGLEHLLAKVVGRVDEAAVRGHCASLPEIERPSHIECVSESDAALAYGANGKL